MARAIITLQDVYNVVNRLEDKMDTRLKEIERRQDDQDNFRNKTMGVLGVFSVFVNLAATWIWGKVLGSSK